MARSMNPAVPTRSGFRYTLSDLLMFVLLIGVFFGWYRWLSSVWHIAKWTPEIQVPAIGCFLIAWCAVLRRADATGICWLCLGIHLGTFGAVVSCLGAFGTLGLSVRISEFFQPPLATLGAGALVPCLCCLLLAYCLTRNSDRVFLRRNRWVVMLCLPPIAELLILATCFSVLGSSDAVLDFRQV